MARLVDMNSKYLAYAALAVTGSIGIVSTYKLWSLKRSLQQINIYETQRSLNEYLVFHFGASGEVCRWPTGPKSALDFPKRCAELCVKHYKKQPGHNGRALDLGCGVGRSAFELTRHFADVVGMDYSHSFVNACNKLKEDGEMPCEITTVGDITEKLVVRVDPSLDRTRTSFRQGDACDLPADLGHFDCVLAANLICRLHRPASFFERIVEMINPGGLLVITSPYSFMREFTPRGNWVAGWEEADGHEVTGLEGLKRMLSASFEFVAEEDLPFLIRETERKHQWTVAHGTVWRRI